MLLQENEKFCKIKDTPGLQNCKIVKTNKWVEPFIHLRSRGMKGHQTEYVPVVK